jgi:hypothetical protein
MFSPASLLDGSIDFVRRHMDEALHSVSQGCIEEDLGSNDVGHDECCGSTDRPVDMGLRCKVDDDIMASQELVDERAVANVPSHKLITRRVGDRS